MDDIDTMQRATTFVLITANKIGAADNEVGRYARMLILVARTVAWMFI